MKLSFTVQIIILIVVVTIVLIGYNKLKTSFQNKFGEILKKDNMSKILTTMTKTDNDDNETGELTINQENITMTEEKKILDKINREPEKNMEINEIIKTSSPLKISNSDSFNNVGKKSMSENNKISGASELNKSIIRHISETLQNQ